ncbi:uncharacterized protein F5891DRAFT_12866 [Suillus fuscotomentosus]|uniref:Uncharacterized protein n=1 Tax=Suillus fuscotomentosus TaxID=1912939 RepID=A0AAD4ELI9_9AGAM|nr:uncharacterized protein F5891DRAFT_12866 [Suillus fuscotomentosus]KAG1908410.1 hypothetical protein F5891DRAFT_12866 [Suillus fuscotomentosus]
MLGFWERTCGSSSRHFPFTTHMQWLSIVFFALTYNDRLLLARLLIRLLAMTLMTTTPLNKKGSRARISLIPTCPSRATYGDDYYCVDELWAVFGCYWAVLVVFCASCVPSCLRACSKHDREYTEAGTEHHYSGAGVVPGNVRVRSRKLHRNFPHWCSVLLIQAQTAGKGTRGVAEEVLTCHNSIGTNQREYRVLRLYDHMHMLPQP